MGEGATGFADGASVWPTAHTTNFLSPVMPRQTVRSGRQTPFGLAEALMSVHTSYLSCGKAGKGVNICSSFGVIRESRARKLDRKSRSCYLKPSANSTGDLYRFLFQTEPLREFAAAVEKRLDMFMDRRKFVTGLATLPLGGWTVPTSSTEAASVDADKSENRQVAAFERRTQAARQNLGATRRRDSSAEARSDAFQFTKGMLHNRLLDYDRNHHRRLVEAINQNDIDLVECLRRSETPLANPIASNGFS